MKKTIFICISILFLTVPGWAGSLLPDIQVQGQQQGQQQAQIQGQGQNQSVNNGQNISPIQNIIIKNPREYLAIPGIGIYIPYMVPGQVLDVTKLLFLPVGLKAMSGNDNYKETITFNGWCLDRIRLEDISQDILKYFGQLSGKWAESSQIRVQVWMKGQTKGFGKSAGVTGGGSYIPDTGALAGGLAGVIGYNTSYQDPQYVMVFYRLSYSK